MKNKNKIHSVLLSLCPSCISKHTTWPLSHSTFFFLYPSIFLLSYLICLFHTSDEMTEQQKLLNFLHPSEVFCHSMFNKWPVEDSNAPLLCPALRKIIRRHCRIAIVHGKWIQTVALWRPEQVLPTTASHQWRYSVQQHDLECDVDVIQQFYKQ